MSSITKTVNVHYRLAKLEGADLAEGETLQSKVVKVMQGQLGLDARERIFPISDNGLHKGCLNFSDAAGSSFLADIMHLDGRNVLPTWMHPKDPKPVAEIIPKTLSDDEASLGEPAYILIRGNHIAAIERMAFRNTNLQRYLNRLLFAGGELSAGSEWKLVPRIELAGTAGLGGPVKRIVFKPSGAMVGAAPSTSAPPKTKSITRRMGDMIAEGRRVIDMAVAAGADETKLEALRASLSDDLALKARLEISVQSTRRKTEARVDPDTMAQAFAELAAEGSVNIVSEDGRTDGKLIQLVHPAEVLETGGLIDWQRATYALASALNAWAAKGAIDLS